MRDYREGLLDISIELSLLISTGLVSLDGGEQKAEIIFNPKIDNLVLEGSMQDYVEVFSLTAEQLKNAKSFTIQSKIN